MKRIAPALIGILLAAAAAQPVVGQVARRVPPSSARATPIAIGETTLLDFAPGDRRQVNVYLPDGYATDGKRYPVLYLIDGGLAQDFLHVAGTSQLGALWDRSRPVIVVGVETKDRRAELAGSAGNATQRRTYPTAGHAAAFRAFIRDSVKPFIAAHYRTDGTDGVIGESLAGLFIVETWLRDPSLFGRYAAISPSLWWDDGALSKQASALIGTGQAGHPLYIASEDEGAEYNASVDRTVDAMAMARGWCFARPPGVTHATIYHHVSPEALQFLFPPAKAPDQQTGFEVRCSRKS